MSNITCYDSDNNLLKILYQWDKNQTVTVKGVATSPLPVFHFCNRLSSAATVVTPTVSGTNLVGLIPNALLQQNEPVTIYVYQSTGSSGYRTALLLTIYVKNFAINR